MLIRNLYSERKRKLEESVYAASLSAQVRVGIFNGIKAHFDRSELRRVDRSGEMRSFPGLERFIKEYCQTQLLDYLSQTQKTAYVYHGAYDDRMASRDLHNWIMKADEAGMFDLLEFLFQRLSEERWEGRRDSLAKWIAELFEREMIAYQVLECQIVDRADQYLHQEVVEGAIVRLNAVGFDKARQDFMEALTAQADGKTGDAITAANSAFESTMKRILDTDEGDATKLIRELVNKGVVPGYLEKKIQALPVMRNKDGDAHGKVAISEVSRELAQYAIHVAGANIVFVISQAKAIGLIP